jgi:hypothetical protein
VFDLLRASAEQIHQAVKSQASIEQVRDWRSMSILLQIVGMTNQWAEALAQSDIRSIEEFLQRSVAELLAVFDNAQSSGMISDKPGEDVIYQMLLDATQINFTGSINGTVRDSVGNSIAGVEARIGVKKVLTDVRGRFRIIKIQLGSPSRLVLQKAGLQTLVVDNPSLALDNDTIQVSIFEMQVQLPGLTVDNGRLSEFNGDDLPELSAYSMTTEARNTDQLRNGDIFVLHKFYKNRADAQLTSKFLDYEDGQFIVLNYKVPISDLPANPQLKQKFLYRNKKFKAVKLNSARMKYFRAMRKARRQLAGRPRPATLMEIDQAMMQNAVLIANIIDSQSGAPDDE